MPAKQTTENCTVVGPLVSVSLFDPRHNGRTRDKRKTKPPPSTKERRFLRTVPWIGRKFLWWWRNRRPRFRGIVNCLRCGGILACARLKKVGLLLLRRIPHIGRKRRVGLFVLRSRIIILMFLLLFVGFMVLILRVSGRILLPVVILCRSRGCRRVRVVVFRVSRNRLLLRRMKSM